ncbi:uncharacterized protein [Misgurnus anguillicaudatus]|uniref:uncharacterized protein isoform X2 n=1 Tax=Misgurnus anguillicaudatus TaxID=75329 RepID=UPI003CCF2681
MSVECPYCGKPFKRLKSHLPHCKMAPIAQPTKTFKTPQDLPKSATTSKLKSSTADKNMIFDERQAFEDRRNSNKFIPNKSVHNAEIFQATTEVTPVASTQRPKSKWSAKRQKERESILQKSKSTTSLSDHEGDKSFCEITNGQTQTSQTNGKTTKAKKKIKVQPLSEHLSITKNNITVPTIQKNTHLPSVHKNPKLRKITFLEETEPNGQSSDVHPVSTVKELKAPTFFTSKTSVWDHIKDSLYNKRSYNLVVPCLVSEPHKGFAFETQDISVNMQQSNQLETAKVSSTPSICFFETSIQRPVEDAHGSRLPCLGLNPEIMTAYRILISTKPVRNSSNENMWNKHRFPRPSSYSKVPLIQQKLGDVRINELCVWLGAKSPKSSRETVTMLKQGWQWYYRKYIDVRKGGMGGISLLFAGYCVLCYIWRYPHLKKERWRKYH